MEINRLMLFFVFLIQSTLAVAQKSKHLEPSLENLFYGNDNVTLTKLFWLNDKEIIAYRYNNGIPKDLILLNRQRLIQDSLSINDMFLEGYQEDSKKFISINGLIQTGEHKAVVIHNFGSTIFELVDGKFKVYSKFLPKKKPPIPDKYFSGFEVIQLDSYTIGYRADWKKWLVDADFWVYDWNTEKLESYEDSKFEEQTKNPYWDYKRDPEPYSTFTHFLYNIIQTKDGFLFNLPFKNRFVIYNGNTNQMQGYTFPDLDSKKQAWFAFYDRVWNTYFAVLDSGNEYFIHRLEIESSSFYPIASLKNKPIGFVGGKCYVRNWVKNEKKQDLVFDHYLIDLYPKVD